MGKSKHKIANWKQYNQGVVNRGSIVLWLKPYLTLGIVSSTMVAGVGPSVQRNGIKTAWMLKAIFKLSLWATEGFINLLFRLINVPLAAPDYSFISKQAKTTDIKYRNPYWGRLTGLSMSRFFVSFHGEVGCLVN